MQRLPEYLYLKEIEDALLGITEDPEDIEDVAEILDEPEPEIFFEPFEKQQQFIDAFFDKQHYNLCYGGSIRGGKTVVGLSILILLSKLYPCSRHAVIRQTREVLKRNTIPSFFKLCPTSFVAEYNKSELLITFTNGSEIMFLSEAIKEDPELDRFKGLEVNTILMEEGNECQEKTFWMMNQRAGSWFMPKPVPSKVIVTCNPSQSWVKTLFYNPYTSKTMRDGFFYLPAKIFDNPTVPQEYLDSLKQLPKEIYNRFVNGSWDAEDDVNQLISWSDIYGCADIKKTEDDSYSLGVDVAGGGRDKTVFILLKGPNIVEILEWKTNKQPDIQAKVMEWVERYSIDPASVCIDAVGIGEGVCDYLHNAGCYVNALKGGSSPLDYSIQDTQFTFKNLRAQMYWFLKRDMEQRDLGNVVNDGLKLDLGTVWYTVKDDKCITIESKEKIKKVLGHSPDYGDAFALANMGRRFSSFQTAPGLYVF